MNYWVIYLDDRDNFRHARRHPDGLTVTSIEAWSHVHSDAADQWIEDCARRTEAQLEKQRRLQIQFNEAAGLVPSGNHQLARTMQATIKGE